MKNQETTVLFINPVPRESAQGRHKQQYVSIDPKTGRLIDSKTMGKVAEDNVTHTYSFEINPNTNKLQTGLDELIKNPYKGMEVTKVMSDYGLTAEWRDVLEDLVKQDRIKLQTDFEIKANVNPGFYTDEVKGGGNLFNRGWGTAKWDQEKTFLQDFKMVLYPRPNRISDETPRGRLLMQLAKNQYRIAKDRNSINNSIHNFFISEENESAVLLNQKKERISEAYFHYYKLIKQETPYRRYQLCCLLKDVKGNNIVKGEIADEKVQAALSSYIDADNTNQMQNIDYFIDKVEMLDSPELAVRFEIEYLVQLALNNHVMTTLDGYLVWHSKSDKENLSKFTDVDKLVSFLIDEFKKYNPKDEDVTNWYKELYDEVKLKGGWLND